MLDATIVKQLESYVALLEGDVVLTLSVGSDETSLKLKSFVEEVAALSPRISVVSDTLSRTPSFAIGDTGIVFAAIPLGHELSSFVLALIQASGRAPKVDASLIQRIQGITDSLHFETYVSLSCHICPDVVQALNIMAVLNPKISHTMIDGGIFKSEIEAHNIMAVPTVMLNGEEFSGGRITLEEIVDKVGGKAAITADLSKPYDILVIGGGPAGSSSAIYAARKGLRVGMITDRMGGQVLETLSIENLISVPQTEGPKLAMALEAHVNEYPIDIIKSRTVASLRKDDLSVATLEDGTEIRSKMVILATGARWRNVNVPGEQAFKNKGVAYCPHCDGPLFEGKRVAVIGGGNSGIEAAIDLAGITKHVTVVEFMPELKADEVLQKRLATLENVTVVTNAQTMSIEGADSVNGLRYKNRDTDVESHVDLEGVFVQIGLVPNTEWLGDFVEKTKQGEIIVDKHGATSVPGIFAAGDCTDSSYKQIIIAMGSGATAALGAFDALIRE